MHGFTDPRFADDDGSADPSVTTLLAAHRPGGEPEPELLSALAASRLLVPVLAVLVEDDQPSGGLRREKTTDMALATVQGRDGRRALPVFTGLDTLQRWRTDARPVPVTAPAAAAAALGEDAAALVVDLAGPVSLVIEGWALSALSEGREPTPPTDDPAVLAELGACLSQVGPVTAAYACGPEGTPADLVLALALPAGLGPADLDRLTRRVGDRLAGSETLRTRLPRGLRLRLVDAGEPVAGRPIALPPAAQR